MDESLFPAPMLKAFRFLFGTLGQLFPKAMGRYAAKMMTTPQNFPAPKREIEGVQDAEEVFLKCGVRAWHWPAQARESKAPIALISHGWMGRASQMFAYAKAFVDAGYEVYSIALPGHDGSKGIGKDGKRTHPVHTRQVFGQVAKELGEVEVAVAHSYGAACCMWSITAEDANIKHMISVASPTHYLHREFAEIFRIKGRCLDGFIDGMDAFMGFPVDQVNFEDIVTDEMQEKMSPVLILHGRDDVEAPLWHAEKNASLMQSADLIVIDDCNHRKITWDPNAINAAMDWLKTKQAA
ncbi:MAG: alpha/beta hydrolase [Gammaproteobacteria bacterium]|nr:alpha/beta hydrolase [Gammaproteobacteria bacterium]